MKDFYEEELSEVGDEFYEDELSRIEEENESEHVGNQNYELNLNKPFLDTSDIESGDPENEIYIMEWLDFLSSKYGYEKMIGAFSYYVSLGWVSKEARNRLISYADGFSGNTGNGQFSGVQVGDREYRFEGSNPDQSVDEKGSTGITGERKINPQDHIKSLLYILKIIDQEVPESSYKKLVERAGFEN